MPDVDLGVKAANEHWETFIRGATLLLGGNGIGFGGCLTMLKDGVPIRYDQTFECAGTPLSRGIPQLPGPRMRGVKKQHDVEISLTMGQSNHAG
jgi:hypothetical protein